MIRVILSVLWESAFAQFGRAGLALIGAVAVDLWVPLPPVRPSGQPDGPDGDRADVRGDLILPSARMLPRAAA